jgi:nucleoside-diphosphate-sugar epimerase
VKILVIGGTSGFIGTGVVRRLAGLGHDVTVFHRGETNADLPAGVREILGDRQQLSDFSSEFKEFRPRVVIDNYLRYEQEALDLVGVFRGISERIVAISSQDVYRNFGLVLGREDTEPNALPIGEDGMLRSILYPYRGIVADEDDPKYNYDKIPVEKVILDDAEIAGTVLRLPATYGPGDKQHRLFEYLKRMDDGREFVLLGDAEADWRWTHGYVDNVADAIVLAATDERAKGRTYNVGEPDALSREKFVEAIGRAAGWNGKIITLPQSDLPEHLQSPVIFEHDMTVDTGRIRTELGYKEAVPRETALRETVEWERANPPGEIDQAYFNYATEDAAIAQREL